MIYFVSDIHLGSANTVASKRAERAFCRWLDMVAVDAKAIYLLGDIFDFWFEYHRVAPQGFVRVLGRLANLTDRGVEVVFITGNHDMWCLDYLTRECGVKVVHKPTIVNIEGQNIHLAHGDNLNIKRKPLLRIMNFLFRSGLKRWMFRWLIHPDIASYLGHTFSNTSRESHGNKPATTPLNYLQPLVEYAEKHHKQHTEVESYIFGHMHIPHHIKGDGMEILFLSDWSASEATYAVKNGDKLELRNFNLDETIS